MNDTKSPQPTQGQEPKPSIGRIVHFKRNAHTPCLAAIITRVGEDEVLTLEVFDPDAATKVWAQVGREGSSNPMNTMAGSWHWPERV